MNKVTIFLVVVALVAYFLGQSTPVEEPIVQELRGLIPEPYYTTCPRQYGIEPLQQYLNTLSWKKSYERNKFDCSEMSAALEYAFENKGYHTLMVLGKFDGEYHMWLLVEVQPKEYYPVEATSLTVILPINKYFNEYFQYDYKFETIYEVARACLEAVDWWNN